MPFDVGKTRQQVFKNSHLPADGATRNLAPEERSMPRFLWHIFKQEGAAGLWKGWVARTLKVAPACAIMISSYEVSKRMARNVNERAVEQRNAT
jgi:solute carrier family 25 protein 39/40